MFHSLLGGGILLIYSLILLFLGMLLLLFYNLGLISIFKMNRIFTYGWCRFIYKLPHLTNHSICSIKINFFLRIENWLVKLLLNFLKKLKISSKFDALRRSWSQKYSFVSNPQKTKKIALNETYLHKKSGPRSFVGSKVTAVLAAGSFTNDKEQF